MFVAALLFSIIQVVTPVWTDGPPSLPAGTKVAVLEGDIRAEGLFTIRLKVPAGSRLAEHTHPRAERVTVLSGEVRVAIDGKTTTFESGGFYVTPADLPHTVEFPKDSEIQLTCEGPWQVVFTKKAV
jgi:quercetin dioxygenase-like cupin family protein